MLDNDGGVLVRLEDRHFLQKSDLDVFGFYFHLGVNRFPDESSVILHFKNIYFLIIHDENSLK